MARGSLLTMGAVKGRKAGREEKRVSECREARRGHPKTSWPPEGAEGKGYLLLIFFIFLVQITFTVCAYGKNLNKYSTERPNKVPTSFPVPLTEGKWCELTPIHPHEFNESGCCDL